MTGLGSGVGTVISGTGSDVTVSSSVLISSSPTSASSVSTSSDGISTAVSKEMNDHKIYCISSKYSDIFLLSSCVNLYFCQSTQYGRNLKPDQTQTKNFQFIHLIGFCALHTCKLYTYKSNTINAIFKKNTVKTNISWFR